MQRIALIAGGIGVVLLVIGAVFDIQQFFQSYLYAFLFWLGFALGPLAALMLQWLTGGRWGLVVRRPLEAGALTLPLMAALVIPILIGIPYLYPWANEAVVAADPILKWKQPYLNVPFFIGRTILYFVIWCGLALLLARWSTEYDRTGNAGIETRSRALSGLGIVLYVLSLTFAMTDWGMSLEPHWFSTMYGVIFLVGQAMASLLLTIFVLRFFGDQPPLNAVTSNDRYHDIGKLLFAMIIFWAYTSFSQYVITWTGNLPEFTPWYLNRITGGWQYFAYALIAFQFFVPFFLLLSRRNKRVIDLLFWIAVFIFAMRAVDIFWIIKPSFSPAQFSISWMDIAAFVGVGGVWAWMFARNLKSRPMLPLYDSRAIAATRGEPTGPQEALSQSH